MARELKKILNRRIGLSVVVDEKKFDEQFANGYLLGEILSKFGLQPDFSFFHNLPDQESAVLNYARILPALEDISMMLPFAEVQKIMQKHPGTATQLVHNLFKTLKVLPMRDPKWSIDTAEKFHRKGTWGEFSAALNVDYETFRKLDDKYLIPGENHCRSLESRLRKFLLNNQPDDLTLVSLRAEAVERNKYRSDWEDAVKRELDEFDKKIEHGDKTEELPPPPLQPIPSARCGVHSSKSASEHPPATPTKSAHDIPAKKDSVVAATPSSTIEIQTEVDMLQAPQSEENPVTLFATLPERVKSKPSLVAFDKEAYLTYIRKKAQEYKKKKEDVAKTQQELWMDLIIQKKHSRELESALQVIRKINKKAEQDRNEARAQLYRRREKFDKFYHDLLRHQEEDEARQYEYVRTMVNQGFWDMLGNDALSEDKLISWCEKAQLRYFPEIYQILCQRYSFCRKVIRDFYDNGFFGAVQTVAQEEGEELTPLVDPDEQVIRVERRPQPPEHDLEPLFNEQETPEETLSGSEIFRTSDQPTLFYSNVEMEEYHVIVSQYPYEELGWMSAFVETSVLEPRNLGHVVSCVLNGEHWRPPPPLEFRFSPRYVNIWIMGKRSSPLKKAVITKLASTYNLEVISIADLVQEAVESALQLQPEPNESKEKSGRRKSKGGGPGTQVAAKKTSLSKFTRGKSRSLAASLSSMGSAGRSSARDDCLQRLLRGLIEDGSVDAGTIVDLVEQAIELRIVHPKPKTPGQILMEAAAVAEAAKAAAKAGKKDHATGADGKHHTKGDSKTRLPETTKVNSEKKDEASVPFGWILTDFPVSPELLLLFEQRLGIAPVESPPPRDKWEESQLIPDDFGPKPREIPRSFFGAIIGIECADETSLLADPLVAGEALGDPPPEISIPVAEAQKATKTSSKPKTGSSPQTLPSGHDDSDDPLNPLEIRRQLLKFFSSLDTTLSDTVWSDLTQFYEKCRLDHLHRYSDWTDPEVTFQAVTHMVESVMKHNRTVCVFGVSPEAQAQINEILRNLCQQIWCHRTGIRKQLAHRLIGTRMGKSILHYLFKQDVRLVRDVYCKIEAQLREVASKSSDRIGKTVGLVVYKKGIFPFSERTSTLPTGDSVTGGQTMPSSYGDYSRPIHYKNPSTFEGLPELEAELLGFKLDRQEKPIQRDTYSDKAYLRNWLKNYISPIANTVSCWHRKNELVVEILELNPPPDQPNILDFPFMGHESHPVLYEAWRNVEERHTENILRVLGQLKMADCRLAGDTKQLQELYGTCVKQGNFTVEQLMMDFSAEYNRMHAEYPDIHTEENWRKKIDRLYLDLCGIVDCRHAGMQCCLRRLMGMSGYTEVILAYRNACLGLFQTEIQHFRLILGFLYRSYCEVTGQESTDEPTFPEFQIPLYQVEEEPAREPASFIQGYNLETPVKFDRSMASGDTEQEQRIFLKIITDDDEFWYRTLQSIRFYLDRCGKFFRQLFSPSKGDPEMRENGPKSGMTEKEKEGRIQVTQQGQNFRLSDSTVIPIFSIQPPDILSQPDPAEETSDNWLDIFEQHDFAELLATVRDDVQKRQNLKKAAILTVDPTKVTPLAAGVEKPAFPTVVHHERHTQEFDRKRRDKMVQFLLEKTVDQEVDHCMLKLCRIAVEGSRKAQVVRRIAAETFCILDCWLRYAHVSEQRFVDEFRDNALRALRPIETLSKQDPKRWPILLLPL